MKHHTYEVRVDWIGKDGEGTKTYKGFRFSIAWKAASPSCWPIPKR